MLGDMQDRNDIREQWSDEWPFGTWVDSLIFRWLRETFLPMLLHEPSEYPEPDEDNALRDALLPDRERHEHALPSTLPPQKAVLFCPLPGQICHLKWWLTKYFADHVDIFHMYADMGNDKQTEMPLIFQDSRDPSVFVMTSNVGGPGLNLTARNHPVVAQKLWELNK